MEDVVVEEYERGGITASAKDAVDRAIDKLQRPKEGSLTRFSGEAGA